MSRLFFSVSAAIVLLGAVTVAQAGLVSTGFDPAQWPGLMPVSPEMKALTEELHAAIVAFDRPHIAEVKSKIIQQMGKYAGTPEEKPQYGQPIDSSTPDLTKVEDLWRKSFDRMKEHNAWNRAAPHNAEFQTGDRLRVSLRAARAYLESYEAGLEKRDEFLKFAKDGFDYLVSAQASTGVFGYPYDPKGPGLKVQAAAMAEKGKALGIKMVENGWLIEDLGDGGLNFDNGMCGIGLLYAYKAAGNERYLDAAKRAGDWAISRKLALNWNYNSFSGYLLARLYRVTGEQRYLDEATRIFTCGVLPGQLENGRWFDQHNAKTQYHSVMMHSLVEFHLALKKAGDPLAESAKERTVLGLGNLAEEINTYGASNVHELLSLDALCLGLLAFGDHPEWEKAANINVNYLCDHFLPELEKRHMPMTETVATYILYRRVKAGKAKASELVMGQ
jgi:hypothetical protein